MQIQCSLSAVSFLAWYLPEYYIQQLANFNGTIYTEEDYGKGTSALLTGWRKNGLSTSYYLSPPSRGITFLVWSHIDSMLFFKETLRRNLIACQSPSCLPSWTGFSIFNVEKMEDGFRELNVRAHWTYSGRYFA